MRYKSIRDYLEKTGKTERQLADEVGVSQPLINMLKNGSTRPSADLALKLHEVTGIPLKAILSPKKGTAA